MPSPSLELHRLTASSQNVAEMLPTLLALSNSVFSADLGSKYASLGEWRKRLASPAAVIIFLAPSASPDRPVAFLFAHDRAHESPLSHGERQSLHVWLAGVLPERRAEGCLSKMMSALDTAPVLTVCTTPAEYQDMWGWLTRRGWATERELDGGKVMLSIRHA
ncbi:uncharacterized protein FIBRA_03153 [Fibroporia radiculosa]|uniref:N-acetyltransferase domain-containing protein n=1 Tax=Fibroporia radiculosa TaxID=599839 RepID=J4GNB6_9APHY|nr:uncharacterized protein FIBRA_03153 [Fibroporia radiculosa]CCM01105.1 predicted protein [Fibroporia radiculosa]